MAGTSVQSLHRRVAGDASIARALLASGHPVAEVTVHVVDRPVVASGAGALGARVVRTAAPVACTDIRKRGHLNSGKKMDRCHAWHCLVSLLRLVRSLNVIVMCR